MTVLWYNDFNWFNRMTVLQDTVTLNVLVFIASLLVKDNIHTKHSTFVTFHLLIYLNIHDKNTLVLQHVKYCFATLEYCLVNLKF